MSEVSPTLNGHSIFEAYSSVSETCAYGIEPILNNLSERGDYRIEFESSVAGVREENIAVNVEFKTLLREGLSEPELNGDLVDKFNKLIGRNDFAFQFRKISLYVTDV